MNKHIPKNEGLLFILKFLGLFALLYYFCLFFISITFRGGNEFYIFLRDHLNFVVFLRYSVLRASELLCNLLGIETYIIDTITIRLQSSRKGLHMGYDCIGYGVMSFWTAFVVANNSTLKKKTYWLISGLITIWIINCLRVTFLLIALHNNWSVNKYLDHHTQYNIISYCLIFILITFYIRDNKKRKFIKN